MKTVEAPKTEPTATGRPSGPVAPTAPETVTRAQLAEPLGLRDLKTITNAMKALRSAGLLRFKVHTQTDSSGRMASRFYKISLRKSVLCLIGQRGIKPLMDYKSSQGKAGLNPLWTKHSHSVKRVKTTPLQSSGAEAVATAPPPP